MKTIRRNSTKVLLTHIKESVLLAVYKGDGYYPITGADVETLIINKNVTSATLDHNGRLDLSIDKRDVGQYIIAMPSLEYAKMHLFPKDFARLHPNNELALRKLSD